MFTKNALTFDTIDVCFSTDNKYAQHLGVTIASILLNTNTQKIINFHVLNDGTLTEENIKNLKQVIKGKENVYFNFITVNKDIFADCFMIPNSHISIATYYRFLVPSVLPSVSKLLYLDCDLIVKADIEELFSIDLFNYYVAAVQDIIGRENQERLNLNLENYYCNAGVLLLNLDLMRQDNMQNKLIDTAIKNKDIIWWQDQDVINMVMDGKIKYLDLAWNFQYFYPGDYMDFDLETFNKAKNNPKIIHYIGSIKPWSSYSNRPFGKEYFKYLEFTPWKSFKYLYNLKSFFKSMCCIQKQGSYIVISVFGFRLKIKRKVFVLQNEVLRLRKMISRQDKRINKLYEIIKLNGDM